MACGTDLEVNATLFKTTTLEPREIH